MNARKNLRFPGVFTLTKPYRCGKIKRKIKSIGTSKDDRSGGAVMLNIIGLIFTWLFRISLIYYVLWLYLGIH